jgi:hypothetical protein
MSAVLYLQVFKGADFFMTGAHPMFVIAEVSNTGSDLLSLPLHSHRKTYGTTLVACAAVPPKVFTWNHC